MMTQHQTFFFPFGACSFSWCYGGMNYCQFVCVCGGGVRIAKWLQLWMQSGCRLPALVSGTRI